jgi:serine phosphatase RsbU (regulator of sigma subunit)
MPGMDGYEVCRRLKANQQTYDIPIIFITAQNDSASILKGFETGAIDYITKPFNIPELMARVKTQLTIKMARDQNIRLIQKIEAINTKLTTSIEYARKIQRASLPKCDFLEKVLPEHFVLLKPRDIVSGDFYWVGKVKNKVVTVVADCTGHGVPGAIMSMFGVAYLHEIVGNNGITKPSEIIDELRSIVIESLQQDVDSEVKDGMDISILTIDESEGLVEMAGAFNPVYLIRNNELTIIPADHMPVSIGETDRPFSNHRMNYEKGDCFYLFTDGFASQFGGPQNKKLKQIGFRNLLLENHSRPMNEQKPVYDQFFETWKGSCEQIDDVLLMGIRF